MILLAQNNVTLHADLSKIFNYVTNMENYKEWFPGVVAIRSANDLKHSEVGKRYTENLKFPQGIMELTIEVKESIKNKSFATEGDLEPLLPGMSMLFTDLGNERCQLNLSYYSRNSNLKKNDELIMAVRKDLSVRIKLATKMLKSIIE